MIIFQYKIKIASHGATTLLYFHITVLEFIQHSDKAPILTSLLIHPSSYLTVMRLYHNRLRYEITVTNLSLAVSSEYIIRDVPLAFANDKPDPLLRKLNILSNKLRA